MIIEILFAILIGICFDRVQMMISAFNYSAEYNGFGVVDMVNKRKIKAPMAYRVLVPWLMAFIESKVFIVQPDKRVFIYQAIKASFVVLAAWSIIHTYGLMAALFTFLILLLTIQFDYWDWPLEMAAIVLASAGLFIPALIVGVFFALSRETAPLTALVYFAATLDLVGSLYIFAVIILTQNLVRLYVGKKSLYCDRIMIKTNIKLYKNFFKWKPFFYSPLTITALLALAAIVSVIINPQHWYILILVASGLTLAKADEPRVLSGVIPFIAILLSGGGI